MKRVLIHRLIMMTCRNSTLEILITSPSHRHRHSPIPPSSSSLHRCTVIIMSDQLYTLFFLQQQQQHIHHHRLTCTTFWSCKIENKVHEREWIASKQKKGKNSKDIGGWKVIRRPTRVLRIRVGTCIEFAFFPLLVILECTLHSSYGLAGCCKRLIEKSRYYLRRLANNYIPVHNYSIYLSIFESPTCI